jgi:uncharacterized damage-inducible protein DinB
MALSEQLENFRKHHAWVRAYTLQMLDDLSDDEWYWSPDSAVTHAAWQAGHIAMAQYGLTLFRQRGRNLEDNELMSGKFRKKFMKGTQPTANREDYPAPDEIRKVLDAVNQRMLVELAAFDSPDHLHEEIGEPNAGFGNKLGALMFACDHEMLHAGQIGLLRRLMGKSPLR